MSDEIVVVVPDPDDVGNVVVVPIDDELKFIEINEGTMGPRGPAGPQGPPGTGLSFADIAFTHIQAIATEIWVIHHPLSFTPNIVTVDSAGTEQIGSITYPSAGTLVVTFGNAFSGVAYLS